MMSKIDPRQFKRFRVQGNKTSFKAKKIIEEDEEDDDIDKIEKIRLMKAMPYLHKITGGGFTEEESKKWSRRPDVPRTGFPERQYYWNSIRHFDNFKSHYEMPPFDYRGDIEFDNIFKKAEYKLNAGGLPVWENNKQLEVLAYSPYLKAKSNWGRGNTISTSLFS